MTPTSTHRTVLPAELRSARTGRQFVQQHLGALDPDALDIVVLLTSELVTNAVIHGGPHTSPDASIDLSIAIKADSVHVEVTDRGAGAPTVRSGAPDQPSGRGMVLIERLAQRWGCDRHASGKTVWIDVARPSELGGATKGRWCDDGAD